MHFTLYNVHCTECTIAKLAIHFNRFDIDVEWETIQSFVQLVYKLTEKEFLPLIITLLEWSQGSGDRTVTFYHLMSELSTRLQVPDGARWCQIQCYRYILLAKITATENVFALSYYRGCGLNFMAIIFAVTIVRNFDWS